MTNRTAALFFLNAFWQPLLVAIVAAVLARRMRRVPADFCSSFWLAALLISAALPCLTALSRRSFTGDEAALWTIQTGAIDVGAGSGNAWPLWIAAFSILTAARLAYLGFHLLRMRTLRARRRIVVTERAVVPMTFGFLRPMIVLPAGLWHDAAPGVRKAILAHERAHVRRNDYFWNLVAEIATACIWWHPAVWWMKSRWAEEREYACDAAAAAAVPDYPRQLLEAVVWIARPAPKLALGLFDSNSFEERMMKLVNRTPLLGRQSARRIQIASLATLAIAGFLLVERPLVFAQDDQGIYSVKDEGVTPPRLIEKHEPEYTQEARDAKIEGNCVLAAVIGVNGTATSIEVQQGLDAGLDQKAIEAIQTWTFQPAQKDGQPVPVRATIEVNFRLL